MNGWRLQRERHVPRDYGSIPYWIENAYAGKRACRS
jgi:hypothetical protein